jgi:pimeloyl-ACP methyl ester carboxylesterase
MRITRRNTLELLVGAAAAMKTKQAAAQSARQPAIDPSLDIVIVSSKDASSQRAIFYVPPGGAATAPGSKVPLVVFLHSWSTDYKTVGPALEESRRRGWIFVGPNFRGPNETPEACASDLAVQDILDSVEHARKQARVDGKRIYLVGSSGGGHMALLMATRAPAVWSAVSTWVPITDLASWYEFSKATGNQYYKMMDKSFGGSPGTPERAAEYRRRSSLFYLAKAKGLPITIDSGLRDGHEGAAVPLRQSLLAFNELARANGFPASALSLEQIDILTRESRIPPELAQEKENEPGRREAVLFRRSAGPVRLTIFDGAHSVDVPTSFRWLDSLASRG